MTEVLARYVEIMRALSTRPDPKAPMPDPQMYIHLFDGHQRPVVAALLTIAVIIREGRHNV